MTLHIQEQYVVENKNGNRYRSGEDFYETERNSIKELYLALSKLYGRCESKVYIDDKAIGWVFVKNEKYEDTGEKYRLETWITLHKEKPQVETHYSYNYLL